MAGTGTGSLTFNTITSPIASTLSNFESQISTLTSQNNGSLTPEQLITLQSQVAQWSIANETFTTILKSLSDTLKGTLQKIS